MPRSKCTCSTAWNTSRFPCVIVTLVAIVSMTMAALPTVTEGKGKPTGGGNAAYTITALPAPDYELHGGPGFPHSISDTATTGDVYVAGSYEAPDGTHACCWTVSVGGAVVAEDLSASLWEHDLDVNSAGIVCGRKNSEIAGERSPSIVLPDRQLVVLPGANFGAPRLNNPDDRGEFQVVASDVLWDITVEGAVIATASLVDPSGFRLFAYDINDRGEIAGYIHVDNDPAKDRIPAVGEFNEGELQITTRTNPNPEVITGFADLQIDNGGNLLGYGVEPSSGIGFYPRAVVWFAAGGVVDLVSEFRLTTARGNGIALVDGVVQVVGDAHDDSGSFSYLYTGGVLGDLNRMSEGDQPWDISSIQSINRQGMICGYGKVGRRRDYQIHGCLLIPNP